MADWRVRGLLVIMAAAAMAGGAVVPFLPTEAGRDVLASGLVLGGLAMLVVALWQRNGNGKGKGKE